MKTLIAVPCMDQVAAPFAQSLAMLQKDGEVAVAFQVGSLVYTSRNKLAQMAINYACDYVLWLDSDMMFPPETLQYMLKECEEKDLDVLSGLYFRRVAPYAPVLFTKLEISDTGVVVDDLHGDVPDSLFELEGIGFGCVLMRTEVLIAVQAKFYDMFTPLNGVGEDLSFCWRARQCGYKIWLDPKIQLGHVGTQVVTKQFFDSYRETLRQNAEQSKTGDAPGDNGV